MVNGAAQSRSSGTVCRQQVRAFPAAVQGSLLCVQQTAESGDFGNVSRSDVTDLPRIAPNMGTASCWLFAHPCSLMRISFTNSVAPDTEHTKPCSQDPATGTYPEPN